MYREFSSGCTVICTRSKVAENFTHVLDVYAKKGLVMARSEHEAARRGGEKKKKDEEAGVTVTLVLSSTNSVRVYTMRLMRRIILLYTFSGQYFANKSSFFFCYSEATSSSNKSSTSDSFLMFVFVRVRIDYIIQF